MDNFSCVVSADLFRRAMSCISTEATRYCLHGVRVEPSAEGGAVLVSTDGSKLICIHDPSAFVVGSGIVQLRSDVAKHLKQPAREGGDRVLVVDSSRAAVVHGVVGNDEREPLLAHASSPGAQVVAYQPADALIDATFPDWRRVIPRPHPEGAGTSARFNGEYLATLAAALCADKHPSIHVVASDDGAPTSPHYVYSGGAVEGFGVIMPLRDGRALPTEAPAWLKAPATADNAVPINSAAA